MRARAAYISSLGTTGILVAAALLMLALVSALVAFRGWPGGMTDSVASVPVTAAPQAPVALTQVRRATPPRTRVAAVRVDRDPAPAQPRVSTAGLVKTTTVEAAPTNIVKVPPGVRMELPPTGTPGVVPTQQPTAIQPVPGDDAPSFDPDGPPHVLPGQPLPTDPTIEDVASNLGDVIGPPPGTGESTPGLNPPVTVQPGVTTTIGVTLGDATVAVTLGPSGLGR